MSSDVGTTRAGAPGYMRLRPENREPFSTRATLRTVRVASTLDPALVFEIGVPPTWRRADGRHAELCRLGLPVPLVIFEAREPAHLSVSVTCLPFEVDLEDWARFRCARSEWHVVVAGPRTIGGRPGLELFARRADGLLRRDTTLAVGRWIVQTHVVAPRIVWPQHRELWVAVGDELTLLHPAQARVEERTIVALGADGLRCQVPASWTLHPRPSERSTVVDAELAGVDAPAWLRVVVRERRNGTMPLSIREAAFDDDLIARGLALHGHPEPDHPRAHVLQRGHEWRSGWIRDALGPGGLAVEVRAWHVDVLGRELDLLLTVPWHPERRLDWMRGVRALELATASLRVATEGLREKMEGA